MFAFYHLSLHLSMNFRRLLSSFLFYDFQTSNIFLTPSEVGVNLKDGYNGDISAKDAGKIGGNMVRKMIQQAEQQMK